MGSQKIKKNFRSFKMAKRSRDNIGHRETHHELFTVMKSEQGKPLVIVDEIAFVRGRVNKTAISWVCSEKDMGCRTIAKSGLEVENQNSIELAGYCNHGPHTAKIERLKKAALF